MRQEIIEVVLVIPWSRFYRVCGADRRCPRPTACSRSLRWYNRQLWNVFVAHSGGSPGCREDPASNLGACCGKVGRAKAPSFWHFARSDAGISISWQCGFCIEVQCTGNGPNWAHLSASLEEIHWPLNLTSKPPRGSNGRTPVSHRSTLLHLPSSRGSPRRWLDSLEVVLQSAAGIATSARFTGTRCSR